jgi:hypothetical protein
MVNCERSRNRQWVPGQRKVKLSGRGDIKKKSEGRNQVT